MFFTAAFALAAASYAMAQDVTINSASLTQCAQSTLSFAGSASPFYVAVLPAENPCGSDAITEFYGVTAQSVDYYVNQPEGTSVQLYIVDANNNEYWGSVMTVGAGDSSCLGGSDASVNSASDSDPASDPEPQTSSSSSSPAAYTPPNVAAAPTTTAATGNSGSSSSSSNSGSGNVADDSSADVPVNAADDTSGASTITASATLIFGAFAAAVALL